MVVKSSAKELPMMSAKSLAKDLYTQDVVDPSVQDTTDYDILFNLLFSLAFGAIVFLLFVWLRPRFLRLYSANNYGVHRARLPKRQEGHFKWMRTVAALSEPQLLAWSGLDGYLFVQVLKLLVLLSLSMGVPMLVVLVPLYALTGPSEVAVSAWYFRLSILNCPVKWLWVPALMASVVSCIFFYVLYVFFRNFLLLRQAYLKDPSAMTCATTLQRLVRITGSIEDARKVASFHNKAVLVDGISAKYDADALKALLDDTPCGPCRSVTVIASHDDLLELSDKRNKALGELEQALQVFLNRAIEGLLQGGEQANKKDRDRLAEELQSMPHLSVHEQVKLIKDLCNPQYHVDLRPTHNISEDVDAPVEVDSISHHHHELLKLDKALDEALIAHRQQANTRGEGPLDTSTTDAKPEYIDRTHLANALQYCRLAHNLQDLSLTSHGALAMVVLDGPKKASIAACPAVPLSRRPFSLETAAAPAHEDILWENVQLSRAARKSRWLLGILINVGINLLYSPVMGVLNALCSLDKLVYWMPWLDEFLAQHTLLKALFTGAIVPFIINLGFSLAPLYLRAVALFQGPASRTGVNMIMIDSYGAFLFFQSFVVVTLTASITDMLRETAHGDFGSVLERLKQTLPNKSSLFFNLFIQRMLISLPMAMLRPIPLIARNAARKLKRRPTPRDVHDNGLPSDFDLGCEYPSSITYGVQVLLAFMTFAPLNLLSSALFFSMAVLAYRYALFYSHQVRQESGGLYWTKVCGQILIGLLLHHVFLLVHFSFRKSILACVLMVAPIVAIPAFARFLRHAFRTSNAVPLTSEEDDVVDALLGEIRSEQQSMLQDYRASIEETTLRDADFLPVQEVLHPDAADYEQAEGMAADEAPSMDIVQAITSNPYNNPVLFKKHYSVMLDPLLFPMLKRLAGTNGAK